MAKLTGLRRHHAIVIAGQSGFFVFGEHAPGLLKDFLLFFIKMVGDQVLKFFAAANQPGEL